MKIDVLTFVSRRCLCRNSSILGRAGEKGIININLINIRDYSRDKHNKADDTPFGGGPGMVMLADPIFGALRGSSAEGKRILHVTKRQSAGSRQERIVREEELVILCVTLRRDRSESHRPLEYGRSFQETIYLRGGEPCHRC